MENAGCAGYSDSRPHPPESKSGGLRPNLTPNSGLDLEREDGLSAEQTLSFLNALLTQLQSQLSEINERSGNVRLFQREDGLAILLTNVRLCPTHQIFHSGPMCPMC